MGEYLDCVRGVPRATESYYIGACLGWQIAFSETLSDDRFGIGGTGVSEARRHGYTVYRSTVTDRRFGVVAQSVRAADS